MSLGLIQKENIKNKTSSIIKLPYTNRKKVIKIKDRLFLGQDNDNDDDPRGPIADQPDAVFEIADRAIEDGKAEVIETDDGIIVVPTAPKE